MMNVKVREVVRYAGHNITANGAVTFNLVASYSELTNTIQAMQMLNNDINIKAKIPGGKAMKLGMFRLNQIVIDGDGESKLKFKGLNDYIEMDNLNALPLNSDENKEFQILMEAEIESEDDDEEDEEDENED